MITYIPYFIRLYKHYPYIAVPLGNAINSNIQRYIENFVKKEEVLKKAPSKTKKQGKKTSSKTKKQGKKVSSYKKKS